MQRSHIASVYIYIYICIYIYIYVYIYIRHTLIARGRGRLHRCGFCGPTYCACEMQRSDLYREIKETLPQKRVRQRRESLTD